MSIHTLLILVVCMALIFDFLNGFHDAANTIATIVVTRTLTPFAAVVMAGLANFIGYFYFGLAVAKTVGKGVIDIKAIPMEMLIYVLIAALLGAILWNLITWLLGLPTSSSHALIGGLVGAALAAAGPHTVILLGPHDPKTGMPSGVLPIIAFILIAPSLGFLCAALVTAIIRRIFFRSHPKKVNGIFKFLQLVSSLFASIGHGTNDAQKSMGIIALALVAAGISKDFHLTGDNQWVVFSCYLAISFGTMLGGWRIVRTMGTQITKIRPMEGFASGSSAALVLLGTSHFGIPVSTTHVITGSIMGVGAVENAAKVRWITARKIMWAWILTIPLTGLCAYLTYQLIHLVMHLI